MSDTHRTSDGVSIIVAAYCDFGHCGPSCWKRCQIPNGRWDGAPTNLYREVWRALRLRRKPVQQSLVLA